MIADEDVEAFWRDGVVCLRDVVPAAWLARLEAPLEATLASGQAADLGVLAGPGEATGRFAAGTDHWRTSDDLRAFASESPLPGLAAALLRSEHVWLYEDSVLVKEPGSSLRTEFHTDAAYFHATGAAMGTFWVPLDPTDQANGTLRFVTGSHRWPKDFRPNLFVTTDPIPGTEGDVVPDVLADPDLAAAVVSFDLRPGDVTVHHARTLHGAPANTTADRRRRALSVRYCGDGVTWQPRPGLPLSEHQAALPAGGPLGPPACLPVWPPTT
ncbi:MAG: phytanoyl-CoA dioxygenase family protein [Microthrixaceae bacterium]|nr:phytanoyl-CoA dioxygenase family protein [Microthrixaceae bacterium]